MKQTNPFYLSKKWKRKRSTILRRDEYQCRECKRYGKVTEATVVHHCFTMESNPEWGLRDWNLISLCNKCHERMHDRNTGELTLTGEQWKERVTPHL
ncbi:HNH endonuclease [Halalkalibacter flavus]|uniref:HNH endonuclease n=1 Tax=Halalkalibacter flavus TaxID=3090668 RepID=UPI002FCC5B39